jgi:hypothetical protein
MSEFYSRIKDLVDGYEIRHETIKIEEIETEGIASFIIIKKNDVPAN